jgi:asparaginyl-tRNA synthetase
MVECAARAVSKRSIVEVLSGRFAVGERVEVAGWVRTRRDSKAGLSFIHLSDGSCFDALQLVAPSTLANYESEVSKLTTGCSARAVGTLAQSQGKGQSLELLVEELVVTGWVEDPEHYPLAPKRHTNEYLREIAHLRPRTNTFGAVARVRHTLSQAIHRFFHERGFLWVHTPIITGSDCEGAGEMFRVSTLDKANEPGKGGHDKTDKTREFFGQPTFLTVSGQLALETYCCALTKVYTFGPTFRAENSNTSRHLAEFWMIEPEVAFAQLKDNVELAESFLKYVFRALLDECQSDLRFFVERIDPQVVSRLEAFVASSFEQVEYTEAIRLLETRGADAKFEFPVRWGMDLQAEHERFLTEKLFQRPVVVLNYPKDIKAFYMRLNDDGRTVAAMDVLAPGIGEIIGGAQREERLAVLDQRLADMKIDPASYGWYRDLRRYGTVPHAGFGLGLERTLIYATGLGNVRDVIPFPRTPGSANF